MIPKISIVTPSFNQGEFLEDCIDSVIEQEYPNFEYLIIDGGSQDRSVEIIRRYENHLTYWISEPDNGQTDAINKGFQRASGEIVAWLNADDYYLPGALQSIAAAYNQFPQASFIFGNGLRVNRNKEVIASHFPENQVRFNFPALLYGLNYILQPATFINSEYLKKIDYLNPDFKFGMDTDLWIRLCQEADPVPVQMLLAVSREYKDTKSKSVFFSRVEELRLIAEKYTGVEITPGILCYFLDTLSRYIETNPGIFSGQFKNEINAFWNSAANQMDAFGARPDGSPRQLKSRHTKRSESLASLKISRDTKFEPPKGKAIGIELRQVTYGKSGGIAQHLVSLLSTLFNENPDQAYVVFCTIFNRDLLPEFDNVIHIVLPTSTFFSQLKQELQKRDILVLFRTYPIVDDLDLITNCQIYFIPDIQHEALPENFDPGILKGRKDAFDLALSKAGAIATNSEFTRRTIQEHPTTKCKDIFLVSPALQNLFLEEQSQLTAEEQGLIPDIPFFYFPANIWPHKNHRRTLKAFDIFIKTSGLDYELILTGHPKGWESLKSEFPHLPVRHLGFVSLPLVRQLYKKSSALVYFSLYEGFGMPVLEAFAVGTPVLCSNVTSLPEVGGDAVLSCDPTDVSAMTHLMTRIASEDSLRVELVRRGEDQLKKFTWEKSAQNLTDAFERVSILPLNQQHDCQDDSLTDINQPKVSIVTPSLNQGVFIRRTIESVLNQTYPNIEYIVIDGGSTDETVEVLQSYGDRFKWISEPDRGQSNAINKGFTWSSGEILGFLNSDDILEPDAISRVVAYFKDNPGCDLVYGKAYYIDENDHITGMYKTDDYSFTRLMKDCCICQPATFWRKSMAEIVGSLDENLYMAFDYDYWLRTDRSGLTIHHIPDILARSRLYLTTKTLSSRKKAYQEAFLVCQRKGGYVDINYFYGLWDHLIWERKKGLPHLLLRWRNSYILMAKIHHKTYHFFQKVKSTINLKKIRRIGSATKNGILHQTKRYFGFMRPIVRRYRSFVYKVNSAKPVFGFWSDNWLGPVAQFYVKQVAPGQPFYIEGAPVVDMNVRIKVEGTTIINQQIIGGKIIRFDVPAQDGKRITFIFSKPILDSSNRYITFLVQGTNLFTEEDPIS